MPFEIHPNVTTPPDNTVLWRYLHLSKFMDMLERRVLRFTRIDNLEDPLEGRHTDAERAHLDSLPLVSTPTGTMRTGDAYLRGSQLVRATGFVSCWFAGRDESIAMWDLYSGGIAVKSSVGLLKAALQSHEKRVFIGGVRYVSPTDTPWDNNLIAMCFRKVLAYRHESEVRAMIWELSHSRAQSPVVKVGPGASWEDSLRPLADGMPSGLEVPFDFQQLITEVWIGPREQRWIRILVEQIMKRYGVTQQVIASSLLRPRT
jgi:hypothetical protein